ncbi:MAG: chorismate mutase family protein [Caldilineaceae bacterium]|nr:chorismate mutase family protein [Caldilineaceae bacterium]MBP8107131.1 chorismate mutase family protein [Caldilineaceae bacterium]MBP8121475.1 chorismate mutase family protein [Caldilineaceae bacterium]MBP9074073.1 chorismate mutase family protein [Caldilineaceae bacterium]
MANPAECTTIDEVRAEIDRLDRQIIQALGERFQYVKAIVQFKNSEAEIDAPARRALVLRQRRQWAEEVGFPPDAVEEMYHNLITHFVKEEKRDWAAKK